MLADVSVPDSLTAKEFEAIVEFDSHLEMEGEFTDAKCADGRGCQVPTG